MTTDQVRRPNLPRRRGAIARALFAAGIGSMTVFGLHAMLKGADVLPLQAIRIQGVDMGVAHEIEAYLELQKGTPLLSVDLDEIRARAESHPFIRRAAAHRVPPETIVVDLVPREPVATIALDSLYLVDQDGKPFKKAGPGDNVDYPVITGIPAESFTDAASQRGAADAVSLALDLISTNELLEKDCGPLQEVHMDTFLGPILQYPSVRVRVGKEHPQAALAQLPDVLSELKRVGRRPAVIHLDNSRRLERVAVRLHPTSEMTGSGRK